jgi:hypothetical protein
MDGSVLTPSQQLNVVGTYTTTDKASMMQLPLIRAVRRRIGRHWSIDVFPRNAMGEQATFAALSGDGWISTLTTSAPDPYPAAGDGVDCVLIGEAVHWA